MTTNRSLKYDDKNPTTHDITTALALAGSLPTEVLDALKVSQIVKQLNGGSVTKNSETNQNSLSSYLQDVEQDNIEAVGRAATEANRDYYQALADKARENHQLYLKSLLYWQNRLDRLTKPL